jgi:hypothetical protein
VELPVVEVLVPVELPAPEEEPIEPDVPAPVEPEEPADPEELPPIPEPELREPEVPEPALPDEPEEPLEPIPLDEPVLAPDPEELASSVFLPQAPSESKAAKATLTAIAGLILDVNMSVSFKDWIGCEVSQN